MNLIELTRNDGKRVIINFNSILTLIEVKEGEKSFTNIQLGNGEYTVKVNETPEEVIAKIEERETEKASLYTLDLYKIVELVTEGEEVVEKDKYKIELK